jgi:hypothetical protein
MAFDGQPWQLCKRRRNSFFNIRFAR